MLLTSAVVLHIANLSAILIIALCICFRYFCRVLIMIAVCSQVLVKAAIILLVICSLHCRAFDHPTNYPPPNSNTQSTTLQTLLSPLTIVNMQSTHPAITLPTTHLPLMIEIGSPYSRPCYHPTPLIPPPSPPEFQLFFHFPNPILQYIKAEISQSVQIADTTQTYIPNNIKRGEGIKSKMLENHS